MVLTLLRLLAAATLIALCSSAYTQDQNGSASAASPAAGAFDIQINAPQDVTALLRPNLELQRYKAMTDLSDAEIQSLLTAAEQDARELLSTMGYFSPVIQVRLQAVDSLGRKHVLIDVAPGVQVRVRNVNLVIEGAIAQDDAAIADRQALRDFWPLASGEPFSQAAWDGAKQQMLKRLIAKRYAKASVLSSHAEVDVDTASVDLELQLDSGPAYKIGSVQVQGNQRYSADLVQRIARLQVGQDYELSEVVQAQQRLTDSGYFDSAYLTLDTAGDPAYAVVSAQVKEATMQKAVLGIGASTDTGARWSAEHTYNQIPSIDWRAVSKITMARDVKSFATDWTSQPGDSRWRWATSALVEQDNIVDIDVATQRYRVGRFTTEAALDQSYYLQFEHTDTVYQSLNQTAINEDVSANYGFSWRHFDSMPFPSSGWGLGGELSAGSVLGAQQEPFARALLHALLYQPLGLGQDNLFSRQHAGRIAYRAQVGGVFVDNANSIPFTQLFLTGGDTTVRGYKYQEIGVTRDGVLTADSGRYLATAGVEWQRPVVRNGLLTDWESALFVDTGAVANKADELSFKTGIGAGARWKSPIGPLQIDLAYGVATQTLRLHLNVGFVF